MKSITKIIHQIVFGLRLENLFAFFGKKSPFFNKFIPHPEAYKANPEKVVTRDQVKFKLTLTDFMQWHIFAHLPDYSWKKASGFLENNTHVLDVGSNCGAFSLKLAHQAYSEKLNNVTVHAFDPNPYIVEKLEHNLSLNPHLSNIVKMHPMGLGAESITAPMTFSDANTGGARVLSQESEGKIMVEISKIDDFVEKHRIEHLSFIKIDVEGYEPFVLLGAQKTIQKFRPAMYIEITDEWFKTHGYSKEFVFDLLTKENYQLLIEIEHKFIDIANFKDQLDQQFQFNLLALPQ